MGELLEFPSTKAQGLAYLERGLRDTLAARGADDELIDFATEQLLRVYERVNAAEQYHFTVHLPDGLSPDETGALRAEIDAGLETLRKRNHALLLELVAQLVLAEVKLFQQQRD